MTNILSQNKNVIHCFCHSLSLNLLQDLSGSNQSMKPIIKTIKDLNKFFGHFINLWATILALLDPDP